MDETGPRLIKGLHAEYKAAAWGGTNSSGIRPIGPHVIILCDECSEVTSGGITLPSNIIDSMNMASEQGVIVAFGEGAFRVHKSGHRWTEEERPKPGERVYFEKYGGRLCQGVDGLKYRVLEDSCIAAIYEVREIPEPVAIVEPRPRRKVSVVKRAPATRPSRSRKRKAA